MFFTRAALLTAILCLASTCPEARVIETQHIEDVVPLIDAETWLLVDLDNCMFQGAQALGHANWFYDELAQRMQMGMGREEAIADFYPRWAETQKFCRVKTLEPSFVPTLLTLQAQGVVIMGLTHRQPMVADLTLRQINSLNFDFQLTAPSKEEFELPSKTPVLYTKGVLFVGDYNKKIDLFDSFLSKIGQRPTKIVFIDDKRKNVDELEILANQGIDYTGVHYTAIEHVAPVYDREIANFQLKFLNQIMSNEAALLLMENHLE